MNYEIYDPCPECRRGPHAKPRHSQYCPRIDLESAVWFCRLLSKQVHEARQQSQIWEGKFRTVKHENNQLRKKLKL